MIIAVGTRVVKLREAGVARDLYRGLAGPAIDAHKGPRVHNALGGVIAGDNKPVAAEPRDSIGCVLVLLVTVLFVGQSISSSEEGEDEGGLHFEWFYFVGVVGEEGGGLKGGRSALIKFNTKELKVVGCGERRPMDPGQNKSNTKFTRRLCRA
ncbi:hypothetical protein K470DRAFT_50585 [Piedraia hortae CBS 480.64]|uniref:Uncharacterized protein n=1 Tax=Piedraia hortae CBS 480.64 TaxID=1314780 RepID=A0A6A7C9Z8_9PEZI|nr:hypothetical protein K470DRAFT_50585 [Piedraia hortae CBS 480.64]